MKNYVFLKIKKVDSSMMTLTLCPYHWEQLQSAMESRNLSQYCPKHGDEVQDRLKKQSEGDHSISSFEPVITASNIIISNAISQSQGSLIDNEIGNMDETKCPVCYIKDVHIIYDACDEVRNMVDVITGKDSYHP